MKKQTNENKDEKIKKLEEKIEKLDKKVKDQNWINLFLWFYRDKA